MNLKDQVDILDKATNKAIKQVDKERKGKRRNFILEWFRYVELVSKQLTKWMKYFPWIILGKIKKEVKTHQ